MTLRQRIIDEIDSAGPMPFERFMEISLYDPEGFFGGDRLRSEQAGDFMTSPEVSSLFGSTLARYVTEVRSRIGEPFQLVEVAAGSGSLLRSLLEHADVDALAVEVSPAARVALSGLVPVVGELPEQVRGVVIANELLDNLPMALAQRVDGRWRERWVGVGDGQLLIEALALAAKRGRVVVTNIHPAAEMSANVSLLDLTLMEKQVVGSLFGSGNPRADIPKLLHLYRDGQLDLDGLVTQTYTLDQVNDGYQDMRDNKNIRGVMIYD